MDFNIAAAFWFASSGRGWLYRPPLQLASPPSTPPAPREPVTQPPHVGASGGRNPPLDPMEEIGCFGGKVETVTTLMALHANTTGKAMEAVVGQGDTGEAVATSVEAEPTPPLLASVDKTATEERERSGKGDKPSKVNKNSDELCPVEGCRRLLKPGCVFGSCSRCCLKVQGFLDAAGDSGTPQKESPAAAEGVVSGPEKKQLQCKAHAVSQALRAVEDHLTNHFDELSSPFCADELALLLRRDSSTRPVRVGRNIHFLSPAPYPGAARQPIKWCPTHKSRSRGAGGGRGEHGEALRGDGSRIGANGSAGNSTSAAVFTSAARVLLVGIGADEFMAGYSRHRNAYNRGGEPP